MKDITKGILLSILISFPYIVFSQGIVIKSGAKILTTGKATIKVSNGGFVNDGMFSGATDTLILSGSITSILSGYGEAEIGHLKVLTTGGVISRMNQINTNTLNIDSSSKLTIDTAGLVIVDSVVKNNAGVNGLVIKSEKNVPNGSFIFHNQYDSPVLGTAEMYSLAAKSTTYKWQFFGIPLRSVAVNPTFNGGYVRKFNEAGWYFGYTDTSHWIQLQNGAVLSPFEGYEVTQLTEKKYYFPGILENRDFSSGKLSYTSTAQYPGQHLIGNPFAAAIDIKKMEFGSADPEIIENTIYLYNTGSYSDWEVNGSGALDDPFSTLAGQYTAIPVNLAGESGIPAQIPSMQAFLVKVCSDNNSASLSISYNSVDAVLVKNTERQRVSSSKKASTRIDVKGENFGDRMWIFTEPTCTENFDNGWDGLKEFGIPLAPQIFAEELDGNYQIDAINDIDNTFIGFKAGVDTEYKMTFTHENINMFYSSLYLFDLQENVIKDISQSGSEYTFTATNSSESTTRFKIVKTPEISTINSEIKKNSLNVFVKNNTIFVKNTKGGKAVIKIFDLTGREIERFETESISDKFFLLLPSGSYVVVGNVNGENVAKSIIIQLYSFSFKVQYGM